jgi:alpha-L-fucosidase
MKKILLFSFVLLTTLAEAQQTTNQPDRVNWFQDLGFGIFIHWNVDAPSGP